MNDHCQTFSVVGVHVRHLKMPPPPPPQLILGLHKDTIIWREIISVLYALQLTHIHLLAIGPIACISVYGKV